MEKFAVDLDRVLDEFEFNEDRAEQVATSTNREQSQVSPSSDTKTHEDCALSGLPVQEILESESECLKTLNQSASWKNGKRETANSVDDFYRRSGDTDEEDAGKIFFSRRYNKCLSCRIHDRTQKLIEKRTNDERAPSAIKNYDRYDKKLNQPNTRPSVSNVFSSLDDYINAPGGHVRENVDDDLAEEEGDISRAQKIEKILEASDDTRIFINVGNKLFGSESGDESTGAPSEYRNFRSPVDSIDENPEIIRVGSNAETICSEGPKEVPPATSTNAGRIYTDAAITEDVVNSSASSSSSSAGSDFRGVSTTRTEQPNSGIESRVAEEPRTLDERSKHSYENVRVAVSDEASRCSGREEAKRLYENVLVDETIEIEKKPSSLSKREAESVAIGIGIPESTVQRPETKVGVSFTTALDDLSEDDLKKYLEELEAEERSLEERNEYENLGSEYRRQSLHDGIASRSGETLRKSVVDNEDAYEAAIFEPVTIGVLPEVSEKKLQEKAKNFPVIDYSQQREEPCTSGLARRSNDSIEKTCAGQRFAEDERARTEEERREAARAASSTNNDLPTRETPPPMNSSNEENFESASSLVVDETRRDFVAVTGENPRHENLPPDHGICETRSKTDPTTETAESKALLRSEHEETSNSGGSENRSETPTTDLTRTNYQRSDDSAFTDKSTLPSENEDFGSSDDSPKDEGKDERVLDNSNSTSIDRDTIPELASATSRDEDGSGREGHVFQARQEDSSPPVSDNLPSESATILGKQPPFWIPDNEAPNCMLCRLKFTVIKRRHHCRACGKVLCNKCCSTKYRLEYQGNIDSRVCLPCYRSLVKAEQEHDGEIDSSSCTDPSPSNTDSSSGRQPNPNNPMEYCSTIPPLQQLAGGLPPPPTVMVPIGVLKREGSCKQQRAEGQKSVMFSDGIRPGCDLTELDTSWDLKAPKDRTPRSGRLKTLGGTKRRNAPPMDPITECYVPQDPDGLPPTVTIHKGEITYNEAIGADSLYKSLTDESEPPVVFAINRNLYACVKITNLDCCVNKVCWSVTSRGLACVGQDEIILLVETLPDERQIPKDLFIHVNQIYIEAMKGNTITELGVSIHQGSNLLGSREHAGFLFVRQTFQCLQKIVLPPAPFLFGLLVHRWETPWAKVFPLRLMLRLGAEYRYYPCPLVSVRSRDSVYFEIGHTIMKVLADFRNFAYTLPGVRGLTIQMHDRTTDVLFPKNRYDQVIKGLNNSNDHVLAFAANFSLRSDSHLVCIQTNTGDESNYQTQAINIHNKPRRVTGASFIVINGALKSSMGLSAKSIIVEDGLMIQILPEKMEALKASLKNMHDFSIECGIRGAPEPDETVNVKWVENDVEFNLGVKSPIDGRAMDGVPSIRVHNGTDHVGTSRFIRWTEVFIIESDDHPTGVHDPVDMNKLSESIARATCAAFVKLLDLLATAGLTKIGVRTTVHPDNVGYEAGSEGTRLPPIYMNSLDNELVPVLHKAAQTSQDTSTVLELIFHVLDD